MTTDTPDLGIPTSVVGKPIFIEVKAPELLRWNGSREVDEAPVRKGIIAALKKAKNKGQLTSSNPGQLVIVSTFLGSQFAWWYKHIALSVLRVSGAAYQGVASVVLMSLLANDEMKASGPQIDFGWRITPVLNPHFKGQQMFLHELPNKDGLLTVAAPPKNPPMAF